MVDNAYIQKMKDNSTEHESTSLPCGCELMSFDFRDDVRPRTLIHRCKHHNNSMVVGSDMSVYQRYQRQGDFTEE